jgi:hypothetical protein
MAKATGGKMEKITIAIDKIDPNPFRDFGIYPVSENRKAEIRQPIEQLGLIAAFTVRPHPTEKGRFQQPWGHHRLEVCRDLGYTEVPCMISDYTDADMIRVMAVENGLQRLPELAVMDSAASIISRIAVVALKSQNREQFNRFMSSETSTVEFLTSDKDFTNLRNKLINGKPIGADTIVRYLPTGTFSDNQVKIANDSLVACGKYAGVIKKAFDLLKDDPDFKAAADNDAKALEAVQAEVETLQETVKTVRKNFADVRKTLGEKQRELNQSTDENRRAELTEEVKALTAKRDELILDQHHKQDAVKTAKQTAKSLESGKGKSIEEIQTAAIEKAEAIPTWLSTEAIADLEREEWLRAFKQVMKTDRAQELWPVDSQKALVTEMLETLRMDGGKVTGKLIREYLNEYLDTEKPVERTKTELAEAQIKEAVRVLTTDLPKVRRALQQFVEHYQAGYKAAHGFEHKTAIAELGIIRDTMDKAMSNADKAVAKAEADKAKAEAEAKAAAKAKAKEKAKAEKAKAKAA